MVTFGWLLDNMEDWITDDTDITAAKVGRAASLALFQLSGERDWDVFKRTVSPSVASLTATVPLVMPANLSRVVGAIIDGQNKYIYSPTRDRRPLKHLYNWFYDNPVATALDSGNTAAVIKNSTAVTSTGEFTDTAAAGEYFRVGEHMGVYKIASRASASAITLTRAFRGDSETGQYFEIRPLDTKQINFCDQDGNASAPTAPEITYTEEPLPLINRWDAIDLPNNGLPVFFRAFQYQAMQRGWSRMAAAAEKLANAEMATAQRKEANNNESMKPLTRFAVRSKRHNWGVRR